MSWITSAPNLDENAATPFERAFAERQAYVVRAGGSGGVAIPVPDAPEVPAAAAPARDELERSLAHERALRDACEARERALRAALLEIENVPRCVACAGRHVPVAGETCSPECAALVPAAVPDPVRDVPTRAVPLWARETMTFDGPPRGLPPDTVVAEEGDPDSARCEFIAP